MEKQVDRKVKTFAYSILKECQNKGFTTGQVKDLIGFLREKSNEIIFHNLNNSAFAITDHFQDNQ